PTPEAHPIRGLLAEPLSSRALLRWEAGGTGHDGGARLPCRHGSRSRARPHLASCARCVGKQESPRQAVSRHALAVRDLRRLELGRAVRLLVGLRPQLRASLLLMCESPPLSPRSIGRSCSSPASTRSSDNKKTANSTSSWC